MDSNGGVSVAHFLFSRFNLKFDISDVVIATRKELVSGPSTLCNYGNHLFSRSHIIEPALPPKRRRTPTLPPEVANQPRSVIGDTSIQAQKDPRPLPPEVANQTRSVIGDAKEGEEGENSPTGGIGLRLTTEYLLIMSFSR